MARASTIAPSSHGIGKMVQNADRFYAIECAPDRCQV
jgi:hypothetical protein